MSGAEEIVEMKAFPQGEISRRDYDRAVRLTREAGRGDILGVVEGRIIEPLSKAQVEQIKAQASLAEQQQKQQFETQKLLLEMEQKRKEFETNYLTKLTELELKYGQNVPGALV
jgi:hypothetical protein